MPRKSEFRITISIFALVLVLALSFSGYYFYKWIGIKEPLQEKLASIEGVEKVTLHQQGQDYAIDINMNKVDDLQKAYESINQTIKTALPNQNYDLNLVDQPNQNLEDFMQHMQPAIYESLANNRFIWLDQEFARRTTDQGLEYKIYVDQNHLFIQLEDNDAYLYRVIERDKNATALEPGE